MTDSLKDIKPATIRKVVDYLHDELGLNVYGQHIDIESAEAYCGCMDYTADEIIALRKFYMNNYTFNEVN